MHGITPTGFEATYRPGKLLLAAGHRFDEAEQVEQEVDEVEVNLHRRRDSVEPRVLRLRNPEEVEDEEAREDRHADEAVNDRHARGERHEDVDDADDDQGEQREHQVLAHVREITPGKCADSAAGSHDAAGAEEAEEDRLPTEGGNVVVDRRPEKETADESPGRKSDETRFLAALGRERHDESTGDERDGEHDDCGKRSDAGTKEGTESADAHGRGQEQGNLAEKTALGQTDCSVVHV